MMFKNIRRYGYTLVSTLALSGSIAYADDTYQLDISSQDLALALKEFARQSGLQVVYYSKMAKGQASRPVAGELTAAAALTQLLENTGLTFSEVDQNTISIQAATTQSSQGDDSQRSKTKDNTREQVLEEMVVTAQKREQSVYDVPMSIMAIGSDELEDRQINSMEDLALAVPGLEVIASGDFQRYIFMRGLSNQTGAGAMVGVFLDDASVTGASTSLQMDILPYDLERVEVLRGPQGTLYGAGAMGGTIRYISKKPQLDQFSMYANIRNSFIQDGAPRQELVGAVNIPVVEDELGFRVATNFSYGGGWIDLEHPELSQDDWNSRDLVDARIQGLWQPTDDLQIRAMALIHRNNGAPNSREDEDGGFRQAYDLPVVPSSRDDYNLYNLELNYDFGNVSLLSSTSYADWDINIENYNGGSGFFYYDIVYSREIFTQEFRLSSNSSGPLNWLVGGYYSDVSDPNLFGFTSGPLEGPPDFAFPGIVVGTPIRERQSRAVFGNVSYQLSEKLEVGTGLRYFTEDALQGTLSGTFDSTDPRFYANYDVADNIKIYTSAASAFRSGGFNTALPGLPPYEPDTVWTYEFGTKMSLAENRLDVELALFYSDYTNFQIFGLQEGASIATIRNAGDVEVKGIDWSVIWQTTENLTLGFNGDLIHSEIVKVNVGGSRYQVGDRSDNIPKYHYTVWLDYATNWGSKPGNVRFDYQQQGRSYEALQAGPSDVINKLNANINWQWSENLSFGVFALNLLNDRGFVTSRGTRSQPRTVGVKFGVDF